MFGCSERNATIVHGETGHIASCLTCARILKARGDNVSFDLMTRVYDIIRLLPLANFDVNANTVGWLV